MEILRLTGQPRLAIINRTGADDHVADWKRRLGLHFNAVREFNAHHATFADRLELLETLAGIEQGWKPKLMRAVAIFREEWERRLGECAEIIVELLFDALTHQEVAASPEGQTRREVLGEDLQQRFIKAVSAREARAHHEIIRLFGHHRVKADAASGPLFDAGLFSDETWRAFGLDEKQLLAAGTVTGAAAGAAVGMKVELGTGGGFLGGATTAGTGIGAGIGAAAAFLFGKQRPELKVRVPGLAQKFKVGGSALRVGPYAAVNFPWILIDRALGHLRLRRQPRPRPARRRDDRLGKDESSARCQRLLHRALDRHAASRMRAPFHRHPQRQRRTDGTGCVAQRCWPHVSAP